MSSAEDFVHTLQQQARLGGRKWPIAMGKGHYRYFWIAKPLKKIEEVNLTRYVQ